MRTLAAIAGVVLTGVPVTGGIAADGTSVGVGEREFRISLYRTSVSTGKVKFNIHNFGEDSHNVVVLSPRGRQVAATPEIRAGKRYALTTTLSKPGHYELLCTVANHRSLGMQTKLTVRRNRSRGLGKSIYATDDTLLRFPEPVEGSG